MILNLTSVEDRSATDPSLPLAFRIARLFGCRIEEIFLDEADPRS